MKARRVFERRHFGLSFLPTHFCVGFSLHTVMLPFSSKKPGVNRMRFVHIHLPFFYITISWRANPQPFLLP